jgi:hypothetical protein
LHAFHDALHAARNRMAYLTTSDWDRGEVRRRAIGIVIALAFEALLIIALLSLTLRSSQPKVAGSQLSAFDLAAQSSSAPASTSKSKSAIAQDALTIPQNPVIPPPLLPPKNPVKAPPPSPDYIKVSKADFDAMDISKLPSNGRGSSNGTSGQGPKAAIGPGEGPGGATLYPVAWYREPTDAEMGPYLAGAKSVPPGAWAEIACRMIDHYHVENCQSLGESPRGTGLAKALRLAAWQFLVRPPRIDNKPQLGVWVRIRFTFNERPDAPAE